MRAIPLFDIYSLSSAMGKSILFRKSNEFMHDVNDANADVLVLTLGKHGETWTAKNRERIRRRIITQLGAVVNSSSPRSQDV